MLSKKDLRKEKTREAIKQSAIKIAEEEGWNNVTIRKIADRVLYTPPIVYEFFKNKDDLYRHLVKDGFEQLTSHTVSATESLDNPHDKLLKICEVRLDFANQNPTLHRIMFDVENPNWQKEELMKAMRVLGTLVKDQLIQISEAPNKVEEHFLNFICLLKGYTYINNHIMRNPKMRKKFSEDKMNMKTLFLDAIKRFMSSIKPEK